MCNRLVPGKFIQSDQELQRLRLLADIAFRMNLMKSREEVAEFICRQIRDIIGRGIVGATLLDEATQLASIKGLCGLDDAKLIQYGLKLTGTDPRQIQMPFNDVSPSQMALYQSGHLELIPDGFYSIFEQRYSRVVSHAVERLFNVRFVYAMGFMHNGRNIGGVAIFTDSSKGVEASRAMIEIIVSHAADVFNRIRIEKLDEDSNTRYRLMFETAPIAINISRELNVSYANPACFRMFGYEVDDGVKSVTPLSLIAPEYRPLMQENAQRRSKGLPVPDRYEIECLRKDGSRLPVLVFLSTAIFADGPATVGFFLDISQRKQAEKKIQASLEEKELLLKEVHHRVKNNMQVISSLLQLQAGFVKNTEDASLFQDSQDRIKSMALIYNKLYQSKDLANINFAGYVKDLVSNLVDSYNLSDYPITLKIKVDDVALSLDAVIPCGLIINETVVNSLKHAFKDGRKGTISIKAHYAKPGLLEMKIADNGVGLPRNLDFDNGQTLGLMLIHTLVKDQLDGEIGINRDKGTEYTITFKSKTPGAPAEYAY